MASTHHLNMTLLEAAQAQKEVSVNEALARIDAVLNSGAQEVGRNAPPASPAAGDVYVVSGAGENEWSEHHHHIAYFDQVWRFIAPHVGATIWSVADGAFFSFDGTLWQQATPSYGGAHRVTRYVPAQQLRPAVNGGCAPLATLSLGTGEADIATLNFDATTPEYATYHTVMPSNWDAGDIEVEYLWSHANASGAYGVVWSCRAVLAGDAYAPGALGAATLLADTGATADALYHSAVTAPLALAGDVRAGAALFLRLGRVADDGGDTLNTDARLHGIRLHYRITGTHHA